MSSFAKLTSIVDVSDSERCTYIGVSESREPDLRCRQAAYHLFTQSGHCGQHLTDDEVATVLPRIRAWKLGMEDLYLAVTTMTQVRVRDVTVHVEVTDRG